ncbi:MAG: hypothetical protein ABJG47_17700 [Ekhidna sp.]
MKFYIKNISLALVTVIAVSCTHEFPPVDEPDAGSADFTKMVSVGNSLTSGFLDNALYQSGQDASFPAIIALQMEAVGGGQFNAPDVGLEIPDGRLVLAQNVSANPNASPVPTPAGTAGLPAPFNATQGNPTAYTGDKSALNNFGVPGMSLGMSLATIASYPPGTEGTAALFGRFAADPATSTQIGDAAAALADGGTFFTFWLGNIDVLGYATGGASNPALLTSDGDFNTFLGLALGALTTANSNAKGAVANIPNVPDVAYFTTISWNPVPLDQASADALNANYAAYNAGISASPLSAEEKALRTINFVVGNNGFVIEDDLLTDLTAGGLPNYRQTQLGDLVILPAAAQLPTGLGTLAGPAADQWVLTGVTYPNGSVSEVAEVANSIAAFNGHIKTAVDANPNLVLVDVNAEFASLAANGVSINGSGMNATLQPPFGGFSLDGVHPNKRGYAYIANLFISAINAEFGSQIPLCNPNDYAGNNLPIPY